MKIWPTQEVSSLKQSSIFLHLIQSLLSDQDLQTSVRKFDVRILIHYLVTAAIQEWKNFQHSVDAACEAGLPHARLIKPSCISRNLYSSGWAAVDFEVLKIKYLLAK